MAEGEGHIPQNETVKVEEVKKQITESVEQAISPAAKMEAMASQIAREKLNGVLPKDFISAAKKQTLVGLGISVVDTVAGLGALYGLKLDFLKTTLVQLVVREGGSVAYAALKSKDGKMQNLSLLDWVAGQAVGNPVFFGGLRNWIKGSQELKKAKMTAAGIMVGKAAVRA
jgi:hypothetical protein